MVNDSLQMIDKDTCRIYQLYFYVNLFHTLKNSSIINEKTLNKNMIEKLLNKILSTDKQDNKNRVEIFVKENELEET